jgi:hypothetical protein
VTGSRAWAARGGRLHALLASAGSFLLEPPEAVGGSGPPEAVVDERGPAGMANPAGLQGTGIPGPLAVPAPRPVVAVFGLAAGCGSTVVSRAVAAELAARDACGTAAVAGESRPAGLSLATKAAARLARALEDLPGGARALGRLCLIRGDDPTALGDALRGLAPLVIDAGSSSLGGVPACIADRTVIVTTPAIEPTLAPVAIEYVARVGPEPTLVLNRARGPDRPAGAEQVRPNSSLGATGEARAPVVLPESTTGTPVALPESRLGAQLALGGREPRGVLGRAIEALVDRWEGGA